MLVKWDLVQFGCGRAHCIEEVENRKGDDILRLGVHHVVGDFLGLSRGVRSSSYRKKTDKLNFCFNITLEELPFNSKATYL